MSGASRSASFAVTAGKAVDCVQAAPAIDRRSSRVGRDQSAFSWTSLSTITGRSCAIAAVGGEDEAMGATDRAEGCEGRQTDDGVVLDAR